MGKSLNPTPYVEFEGPCIQFFANGKKKSIINYDDGRQLGEATYYYPSSGIYAIKEYQEYGNVYLKKCVDSAGHIIADNGKGHWIDYDPGMERITMQGDIDNGKPQGKWSGRVNDTLTVNMNYVNGELQKGLSTASSGKSYSFTKESMFPKFKGGIESFYKFLAQNIRMPPSMVKSRVGGKVFISFMVEKDGSLSNFITEKGLLDKAAEKEAIRVIALSSGMWKPALKYGLIPERQEYIVPLNFAFSYR